MDWMSGPMWKWERRVNDDSKFGISETGSCLPHKDFKMLGLVRMGNWELIHLHWRWLLPVCDRSTRAELEPMAISTSVWPPEIYITWKTAEKSQEVWELHQRSCVFTEDEHQNDVFIVSHPLILYSFITITLLILTIFLFIFFSSLTCQVFP